jgi:hypothetical protein
MILAHFLTTPDERDRAFAISFAARDACAAPGTVAAPFSVR